MTRILQDLMNSLIYTLQRNSGQGVRVGRDINNDTPGRLMVLLLARMHSWRIRSSVGVCVSTLPLPAAQTRDEYGCHGRGAYTLQPSAHCR